MIYSKKRFKKLIKNESTFEEECKSLVTRCPFKWETDLKFGDLKWVYHRNNKISESIPKLLEKEDAKAEF